LLKGKNILSSWLATPTSIKPPAARIEAFPPDERGIRHYPAFGTRLWGGNIQQPGKSKSKTAISIDAGEWE
jgi:hypothetical protein